MSARSYAALAIVIMMIQVLPSARAHGQRLHAAAGLMPAATGIALPGASGSPVISLAPADAAAGRSPYALPGDSASAAWKRRMRPYVIGGAIIGGVAGYAVMPKSCDVGDNMFCGYTSLLAYPWVGLALGSAAGLLVGSLREPR